MEEELTLLKNLEEARQKYNEAVLKGNETSKRTLENLRKAVEYHEKQLKVFKEINKQAQEREKLEKEYERAIKGEEINNESALKVLMQQTEELKKQATLEQQSVAHTKERYEALKNGFNTLKRNILEYESTVNGVDIESALSPKEAHKRIVEMERSAARLGQRMGEGKEGAARLTDIFRNLQKNTGESAQNAKNIVASLSSTGYVGNVEEAATAMSLFTRATGAEVSNTTEMLNSLTKIGKFSDAQSANVLANITKIQQKNGITEKGMNAIVNSISKATNNMKAFGQSEEAIKRMTIETAKLVSGMEKVGVSAETAVGWINQLTDVDNLEKNIPLYAQLGISISDALSGNLDTAAIGSGMKEFGQKLKDMGPIAGREYAKAFGVSYQEAIKAADFEAPDMEGEEVKVDENLEALKEMKEATLDASAKMSENLNALNATMQGFDKGILRALDQVKTLWVVGVGLAEAAIFRNLNTRTLQPIVNQLATAYKTEQYSYSKELEAITQSQLAAAEKVQRAREKEDKEAIAAYQKLFFEFKAEAEKLTAKHKQNQETMLSGLDARTKQQVINSSKAIKNFDNASKKASTKMKNGIGSGGRNAKETMKRGITEGGYKAGKTMKHDIESSHVNTGGGGAVGGAGGKVGGYIALATTVLTMSRGLISKAVNNLAPDWGKALGKTKFGTFVADIMGIDTLKDSLDENTKAINENSDTLNNEKKGPAQIFADANGKSAITHSGKIINNNGGNTSSMITTNVTQTVVKDNSAEKIVNKLDEIKQVNEEGTAAQYEMVKQTKENNNNLKNVALTGQSSNINEAKEVSLSDSFGSYTG